MAGRVRVAARRIDVAIVVEVQVVRAVAIVAARRGRPTVTVFTDTVQTSVKLAAITRSWVPDGKSRTELAGEIHACDGTVV